MLLGVWAYLADQSKDRYVNNHERKERLSVYHETEGIYYHKLEISNWVTGMMARSRVTTTGGSVGLWGQEGVRLGVEYILRKR